MQALNKTEEGLQHYAYKLKPKKEKLNHQLYMDTYIYDDVNPY